MDCVFCAIVEGKAPAVVVYEDETTVAFMDINPANPGHTLVIPKQHVRDIFAIDEETAVAVMRATVRVARAIEVALQPDGINLIQANRRAAFQSVFHSHMHIIPRWWGDDIVLPWQPTPGDPAAIQSAAARIREHIEEQ
ncbi:MAG: HIT family protein [Chloroflexi bacterium]|nr:HIT family protein [Chloroflexota bacterium]